MIMELFLERKTFCSSDFYKFRQLTTVVIVVVPVGTLPTALHTSSHWYSYFYFTDKKTEVTNVILV